MEMGHKKHGHCPYAQVEDAPKVLGHVSISKERVGLQQASDIMVRGGT